MGAFNSNDRQSRIEIVKFREENRTVCSFVWHSESLLCGIHQLQNIVAFIVEHPID